MKNMFKIVIGISIILLSVSMISAANINDWKLPDNFKSESDVWASNGGYGLSINEYNDEDYDLFFRNSSDYTVVTANNITNYTDHISNQVGCDEVIEDDGVKYLVECYNSGPNNLEGCYQYLLDFNKLNDVSPIEI